MWRSLPPPRIVTPPPVSKQSLDLQPHWLAFSSARVNRYDES